MNAIARVFEAVMGEPRTPVEIVAEYFRSLAGRGKGCTTNNHTIAVALGLSTNAVRAAKHELVKSGRLVGTWQVWSSIDGVKFDGQIDNEVEVVKTILRRQFTTVCDARTVDNPARVALGRPDSLFVGSRVISWDEALQLARRGARK